MTPGEFREFARTMQEFGISQMKMGDVEIMLGQAPQAQAAPVSLPLDAPQGQEDPIKHKVEQLSSLLKLDDHQLVDQLFPDHTQTESA